MTDPAIELGTSAFGALWEAVGGDAEPTPVGSLGALLYELGRHSDRRRLILAELLRSVQGERAFFLEIAEDETCEVLESVNLDGEPILNSNDKIILPLAAPCRERAQGYLTFDLPQEPIAASLARSRQPKTQSLLICPLPDPSRMVYVDHRFQALDLDRDLEFAWLFGLLASFESEDAGERRRSNLVAEIDALKREAKARPATPTPSRNPARPEAPADSRDVEGDFRDIVGQHPDVIEVLRLIQKVAPTQAPILINGESGTGKELAALAIHKNSDRARAPFVSENCAALAENLLEAELFGAVKGAYTGAYEDRPGLFEHAHGGTLFLDEIGDTTPGLQKKLLRALQEGVIRRVGGQQPIPVDVRIVSATNKDLMTEVRAGRFREDLFYRLNVINVSLPPLRERREDIPLLAQHFVDDLNADEPEAKEITPKLISALMAYHWPGNIRELRNEVCRVFALSGRFLQPEHLSARIRTEAPSQEPGASLDQVLSCGSLKEAAALWEKEVLAAALKRFHGNKAQVSSSLKIPKTTLYARLKRHGLFEPD